MYQLRFEYRGIIIIKVHNVYRTEIEKENIWTKGYKYRGANKE